MMEPTDNAIHAGCLGNINATWTFHGALGHSARPWLADNAIHRAAAGIAALAAHEPEPHEFDGLEFVEVASVTRIAGGIAGNVIPDRGGGARQLPLRARPHAGGGRGAAGRAVRRPRRAADRRPTRRRAPVATANPLVGRAGRRGRPRGRAQAGVDAGRRVRGSPGIDAVNFGPGDPPQAHTRATSRSRSRRCVRGYRVLEAFAA